MSRDSTTATVSSVLVAQKAELAHRSAVFAILGAAVVADQVVKGWAWRNAPEARINFGGNAFVGDMVSAWYADPVTGALLDLAGFGVLSIAVLVLLRRRLPFMILISGTLMTAGWISNLCDRLGMHYWTAPNSVRGAVDFIPLGRIYYNVADVFIAIGTVLFLLAMGVWATKGSATTGSWAPMPHGRLRSRMWMGTIAVAVCLVGVVGFGAVNYGGVTAPSTSFAERICHGRGPSSAPVRAATGFHPRQCRGALVRCPVWRCRF